MAMSKEHINEVLNEVAVVCCRTEKGTIISHSNLEDPGIFADLIDSGLLHLNEDTLKIKDVLGAKLIKTIDSLTPLTKVLLEGEIEKSKSEDRMINNIDKIPAVLKIDKKIGEKIEVKDLENHENILKLEDSLLVDTKNALEQREVLGKILIKDAEAFTALKEEHFMEKKNSSFECNNGILKIKIGEGKNIDIEIPMNINLLNSEKPEAKIEKKDELELKETIKDKKLRCLTRKYFNIEKIEFGNETKINGTTLYIRENLIKEACEKTNLVVNLKVDIITPEKYQNYSETIMDVQPIATKEGDSKVGTGITRILKGVVVMVTGIDEKGVQIGEFGSSEGILEDNIMWGRPGSPDKGDIIIKTQVIIKEGTNMERPGPLAAHCATDIITQEIREALKKVSEDYIVETEELIQMRRKGKRKVVLVKEIMGQGAMHDNLILPIEPVGVLGGKPNVDLGNIPIVLSPLEVLDGGIHALTCIGPASKECSRHYFREPLVIEAMNDENIDLCGVIFIGSPQVNNEKFYVSERLGMMVEAMDIDGAIVTTEGFGNNHIDFASHIEQIGMRGIKVVGMSFCGVQGALVVGNKYMQNMIDNNKSELGIENEILACNTLCKEDAIRALEMLKSSMEGIEIKEAERKWDPKVKNCNLSKIEKETGISIERVSTI